MSARTKVGIAGRSHVPGADHGVCVLLTATGWVLQRLPGAVLEDERGALQTWASARHLAVEVHTRPSIVLVRDGDQPLVKIPANGAG